MIQDIIRHSLWGQGRRCWKALTTLAAVASFAAAANAATVSTELPDYPPGSTVWIIGEGFSAWETVTVQVSRLDGDPAAAPENDPWPASVDGSGVFFASWQIPFDGYVGETLLVTALGNSSSLTATTTFTDAPGVTLDQMRNGAGDSPDSPVNFVNGNAGSSNAHLNERWSQAYRAVFTGFTTGDTIEFVIGYDITHSSKHSFDYLTYYNRIDDPSHNFLYQHSPEVIDPTVGLPALPGPVYAPIPPPPVSSCSLVVPNPVGPAQLQPCTSFDNLDNDPTQVRMSLWGGSFYPVSPVTYDAGGDPTLSQSEARVRVKFIASGSTILLAWGGHIAWNGDWGAGNSAGGISGSPYHTRAIGMTINGVPKSVGNQDRSMQAGVVLPCVIEITCPPDITVDCDESTDPSNTGTATYTAGAQCGGVVLDYYDDSSAGDCPLVITRWWRARGVGGIDSCAQTITVDDTEPPTITCPSATSPIACPANPSFPAATATDNCDASPTVTFVQDTIRGSCAQEITVRRVWTATDDCGNTSTCTQTVAIEDNTPPSFPNGCGSNATYQCASQVPAPSTAGVVATDACQFPVTVTVNRTSNGGSGCVNSPLVFTDTYTATDDCGNSSTCSKTHTVIDNTPPTITCAAVTSPIECPATPAFPAPTVSDNCDADPAVTFNDVRTPGSCPAEYSVTRTWTATDDCGNSASCSRTVVVQDNTPPTITCAAVTSPIECPAAPVFSAPTVSDNCDADPAVTFNDVRTPGSCPAEYSVTRTWTATDDCGNEASCSRTVVVQDNTPPTITCAAETSPIPCPNYPTFHGPTVSDNCDASPTVSFNEVRTPGSCPQEYSVTRTWTAADECGNSATCSQTVAVVDDMPPVLSDCDPLFYECDNLPPGWPEPTATDNCDGDVEIALISTSDTTQGDCPQEYSFILTWEARDDCGNAARCEQTVNVYDDTRPTLICAPDTTVFCTTEENCLAAKSGIQKLGDKFLCDFRVIDTAYDNCDGNVEVTMDLFYDYSKCPRYIRAKVWAEDDCGLVSDTCLWTVYFVDETPPVIVCPNDLSIECDDPPGDWGWPTATDECTTVPTIRLVDQDTVMSGCRQVITRTFAAVDSCENESRCVQTITIGDVTDPVCQLPGSRPMFLCDTDTTICLPVSATDNCDQSVICEVMDGPGAVVGGNWCYAPTQSGPVTVFIECRDDCGNTCDGSFTINFMINSAPVCDIPNDTAIYLCDPATITLPVSASDLNQNLTACRITSGPGSLTPNGPGSYEWSYNATKDERICVTIRCEDECGAFCEKTFCVSIDITEPPVCYQTEDAFFAQCDPTEVCLPIDWPTQTITRGSEISGPSKGGKGPRSSPRQQSPGYGLNGSQQTNKSGLVRCQILSGPGELRGGSWCWTPPDEDVTVTVLIQCTDSCGHTCQNEFTVRFDLNEDPVCSFFGEPTPVICTPKTDFVALGSTDPEGGPTNCYLIGPGQLVPGGWEYQNPEPGTTVNMHMVCSDTCGDSCVLDFSRTYPPRVPVICHVPNDTTIFLCQPTQLALPVSGGEEAVCSVVNGPGSVVNGNWTYFADEDTEFSVTIRCLSLCDSCEAAFRVRIEMNDPPECHLPNDTSIFLCGPQTVCLPVTATDPNGNFSHCEIDNDKGGSLGYIVDGQWCYDVTGDAQVTVPIVCFDDCGASCRGEFTVNFDVNEAPICTDLVADTSIFLCQPQQICVPFGAIDEDENLDRCEVISGQGEINNGYFCFTPGQSGDYAFLLRCTDDCGASCEESITFHVTINAPPSCGAPHDTTIARCTPGEICLPFAPTDPDGNLGDCEIVAGSGVLGQGAFCFTATVSGDYAFTIRCTDDCGVFCEESFTAHVTINAAPTINLGVDISQPQEPPGGMVCFNYTVSDPNGLDGLIESLISGPAGTTIDTADNEICVPSSLTGKFEIIAKVVDGCEATDDDSIFVIIAATQPPVCNVPGDTSVFLCAPTQICRSFSSSSSNPPVTCQVTSGPGAIIGNNWCYTASAAGSYPVTITCTDAVGNQCSDGFTLGVAMNRPPECSLPNSRVLVTCERGGLVCVPITVSDPDNNLVGCQLVSGPGSVSGEQWCFSVLFDAEYTVIVRCWDACGAECRDTMHVIVDVNDPPIFFPPHDTTITVCDNGPVCIPLTIRDGSLNLSSISILSGGGQLVYSPDTMWCVTPPAGTWTTTVTIRATDACGAIKDGSFKVTTIKPESPSCALPPNATYRICQAGQVCLPIQNGNPIGVTCTLLDGPGSLSGNNWCYNVTSDRTLTIKVRCANACGEKCEQTRTYTFLIRPTDCTGIASVGEGIGADDKSFVAGDVDGSGDVNIADVAMLTQIINQLNSKPRKSGAAVSTADANHTSRADVNCDGVINSRDLADLSAFVFQSGPQPCPTK